MNSKKFTINTNKANVIQRFKESFSSPWMLGEPRTIGSSFGSLLFIRRLFGEKPFCKWDFFIYIEAICKLTEDKEGNTTFSYKIVRGFCNPVKLLILYAILFIPIFMNVASNHALDTTSPLILYAIPAIPVLILVIVTHICSRVCKEANENIKILEEEIIYEVERINKYPAYNVKTDKLKNLDL